MRVLRILLALLIAPFLASVSQAQAPHSQGLINGQGHDAAHCAMRAALHPNEVINKCGDPNPQPPPPPPQPPPSCPTTVLSGGTVTITGKVTDAATGNGLANWCIQVFGTLSGSTTTDATGNYSFTGLPPGTYSVCEVVQSGWTLVFPSSAAACPGGTVYTFTLNNGDVGGFVNFRNTFP